MLTTHTQTQIYSRLSIHNALMEFSGAFVQTRSSQFNLRARCIDKREKDEYTCKRVYFFVSSICNYFASSPSWAPASVCVVWYKCNRINKITTHKTLHNGGISFLFHFFSFAIFSFFLLAIARAAFCAHFASNVNKIQENLERSLHDDDGDGKRRQIDDE